MIQVCNNMRLRLNYPFKHRISIDVTHSTDVLFQSAESMHCPSQISSLWQWRQRLRGRVLPLPWALPLGDGNAAQSCPWLALPSLEDPARSFCGGLFEKIRGSCHSGQSPSRYLAYLCQSLSSLHILLSLRPLPFVLATLERQGKRAGECRHSQQCSSHLLELQVSWVQFIWTVLPHPHCACTAMDFFSFYALQILSIWRKKEIQNVQKWSGFR